jgi:pilus assembly protein CpaE
MKHRDIRQTHQLQVAAILRSSEVESTFSALASQLDGLALRTHTGPLETADSWRQSLETANVILLDVDPDNTQAVTKLAELVATYGEGAEVVATAPEASTASIRRLLRTGISDFLPQPFSPEDLETTFAHLRAQHLERARAAVAERHGRVVSFIGSQGGAGTTTLAVQTACALVPAKARTDTSQVCLIDLDVQSGQASFSLDIDTSRGLNAMLETPEKIDASFLRDCAVTHKSGIDVIAAPGTILPLDVLTPEFVARLIDVARQEYEFVVLDLPMAWSAWKHEALMDATQIVLVIQVLVPSLRMARQQLQLIEDENLSHVPLAVAANRYARGGATVGIKEAEQALDRKIDFLISNDFRTVSRALDHGVPIFEIKRRCRMVKDIRKMIAKLPGLVVSAAPPREPAPVGA